MDFEEFKRVVDEQAGPRSELSKEAREVGRRVADLPD